MGQALTQHGAEILTGAVVGAATNEDFREAVIDTSGVREISESINMAANGDFSGAGQKAVEGVVLKKVKTAKKLIRQAVGKEHKTKKGYMGKQQPYNGKTGKFLPFTANSGVKHSPAAQFGKGFVQGVAEAQSGGAAPSAPPVGTAGTLGHSIGTVIGNIMGLF